MEKVRLLRITTVPISLTTLLKGQVSYLSKHGFDVLTVSSPGSEVAELTAAGVKHVAIAMSRKITPVRDLWALLKLVRLILKFKPDIVHTHTPKAGLLGMMAAWLCRVPARMHTVAGLPWMESRGPLRKLLQWMERLTYSFASRVYPNSKSLAQFLKDELNFETPKLQVIGSGSSNGIDTHHFRVSQVSQTALDEIRARFLMDAGDVVFCFVGRIVKAKGIAELVEAFTHLEAGRKTWLLLVGQMEMDLDGLSESTLKLIRDNPRIIETGFQADVRPWLAASNIFVFPSYREGFPNGVMQAACMELPCIVSDINGCNEIIQAGHSGFVIPAKNAVALQSAMQAMMRLPDLGKTMGMQGREFVVAHFEQRVVWEELLREYRSFLE